MDGCGVAASGLEDRRQDDELRTLNGNSYHHENEECSRPPLRSTLKTSDKGILRGPGATMLASEQDGPVHNVAFLDPAPDATYFRSRRQSPNRNRPSYSLTLEHTGNEATQSYQPLNFEKRHTYSSGRSSFSCSACSENLPISPLSDGTGRSSCPRTPSLCRSETEASEPNSTASAHQTHCPHVNASQHVSLLTAALLAGETSPKRSPQYACGILKRQAQASAVFEADSDSGQATIGDKPTGHTRFIEPPKPTRLGPRRISLPPNRCGPRLSTSPDHYSEGPDSPPRPLMFDAQAHAAFAPPGPSIGTTTQDAAQPGVTLEKKRVLTFQDAVGHEDRARTRENQAGRPRLGDRADRSRHASTSRPCSPAPSQARPSSYANDQEGNTDGLAKSPNPSCISQGLPGPSSAVRPPQPRECFDKETALRKLHFAASPSELRLKRTSASKAARQSKRGDTSAATSEDEGPYVDSVAAFGPGQRGRDRAPISPPLNRSRSRASPAPTRPSILDSRGSSRQRRKGSPAPRPRITSSETAESPEAESDSEDEDDDLDYDEDDEDESGSDDDDSDSSEQVSGDERATTDEDDSEGSEMRHKQYHNSNDTTSTSPMLSSSAKHSPQLSISSRTHPAAFSSSEWEEEDEGLVRNAGDPEADAFEAYFCIGGSRRPSRTAHSPLPFARGRLPSTAVSDAEGWSRQPSPAVTSPGQRPQRPSISPVRSRSSAVAVPSASAGRAQSKSASRSFSSTSRCAPSLLASAEQAQAQPTSPPPDPQSLDAWSKLRSCLETAIGGSDGPPDVRRPWFSAMSTPGGRTLSISPHQLVDHRPMTLASAALSTSVLDGGIPSSDCQPLHGHSALSQGGVLGLEPPAQIDSDVDWSADLSHRSDGERSRRQSDVGLEYRQRPIRIVTETNSAVREDTLLAGVGRLKTNKRKPFKSCSPSNDRSSKTGPSPHPGDDVPRGERPVRPRSAARLRSRRPSEMQFGWGRPDEAANVP